MKIQSCSHANAKTLRLCLLLVVFGHLLLPAQPLDAQCEKLAALLEIDWLQVVNDAEAHQNGALSKICGWSLARTE